MSRSSRRILARVGLTTSLIASLGLASASTSFAATTIGQLPPGTPPVTCTVGNSDDNADYIQPAVASGASYVVPAGGVAITSWSTKAAAGVAGQQRTLKVFRKIGEPAIFQVVNLDGPRTLTAGVQNTFPVNLPVLPGDLIGMQNPLNSPDSACWFDSPGNNVFTGDGFSDLQVGQSQPFTNLWVDNSSLNLSAVVGFKASNEIDFVKVKKNKNNGTATLTVDVPGPGELSLKGPGVKPQRPTGATISKDVTEAGKVKLRIKAKGAKKGKLLDTGKVKVKVKVTFKPSATGGDVAGDPNTDPKTIKLIDN